MGENAADRAGKAAKSCEIIIYTPEAGMPSGILMILEIEKFWKFRILIPQGGMKE